MPALTNLNAFAVLPDIATTPLDGGSVDTWGVALNQDLRSVDNMALDYTTFKPTTVIKGVPVAGIIEFSTPSLSIGLLLPNKSASGAPSWAATAIGMSVFSSGDGHLYVADGSSWISIGASGSVPIATDTVSGTVKTNYTETTPIAQLAGASTGGNARGGTGAVDLQLTRSLPDEVAAADHSAILGGDQNKASQVYGIVVGGQHNYNDGVQSAIVSGSQHYITSSQGFIGAGTIHEISPAGGGSADFSSILNGYTNLVESDYATILNGDSNHIAYPATHATILGGTHLEAVKPYSIVSGIWATSRRFGEVVHSSGDFSLAADAQYSTVIMRADDPTGGSPVELFCDGTTERLSIIEDTSAYIEFTVIGRRGSGSGDDVFKWTGFALVNRQPAGNVTLLESDVVAPTSHVPGEGLTDWHIVVAADTTNQSLQLTVERPASPTRTMHWTAIMKIQEIA